MSFSPEAPRRTAADADQGTSVKKKKAKYPRAWAPTFYAGPTVYFAPVDPSHMPCLFPPTSTKRTPALLHAGENWIMLEV